MAEGEGNGQSGPKKLLLDFSSAVGLTCNNPKIQLLTLFASTSQQYFSLTPNQHQQTIINQSAVFFSHNKSAPATSDSTTNRSRGKNESRKAERVLTHLAGWNGHSGWWNSASWRLLLLLETTGAGNCGCASSQPSHIRPSERDGGRHRRH